MEWLVKNSDHAATEIAAADHPNISHFKVPINASQILLDSIKGGQWEPCSTTTVAEFSAVAYYFAKSLQQHTDVTIGLINSSWGGSALEPWMNAQTLGYTNIDAVVEAVKKKKEYEFDVIKKTLELKFGPLPKTDQGYNSNKKAIWANPSFDDSNWQKLPIPCLWEDEGLDSFDGFVWFRKTFELTAEQATKPLTLHLGKIDDSDITWLNGHQVGSTVLEYNTPRAYIVETKHLVAGKNTITVRVEDTGGGGGIWGDPQLLFVHSDQDSISLAGDWAYKIGAIKNYPLALENQTPTLLYNAMIYPLLDFPIAGVIWYQGETNAVPGRAYDYRQLFPKLITQWREDWGCGDFPFLYVQLANFRASNPTPEESDWAMLRESQTKTLALENVAQIVTIDIGDSLDIHPKNKQDVGARLALAARHFVFNESITYSGPVYKSMKIEGNKIRIQFDHVGKGLLKKGDHENLEGFSIAGSDQKFVWANAYIDGDEVVVYNDRISEPVAIRYAWADNPAVINFYNKDGLPATPFRTDEY